MRDGHASRRSTSSHPVHGIAAKISSKVNLKLGRLKAASVALLPCSKRRLPTHSGSRHLEAFLEKSGLRLLQGYLAHQKHPLSMTTKYTSSPMVVLGEGAVYCEHCNPVVSGARTRCLLLRHPGLMPQDGVHPVHGIQPRVG